MILLKNVISICLLCNTILEPKYEYSLFLALSVQIFRQIAIFVVFVLRLLVCTVHEVECALPCGVLHSVGDLLQLVVIVGNEQGPRSHKSICSSFNYLIFESLNHGDSVIHFWCSQTYWESFDIFVEFDILNIRHCFSSL